MCKEEEELEDLDRKEKRKAFYNKEITKILDCMKQLQDEGFRLDCPRMEM